MSKKRIHTKSKITEEEMRRHISGESISHKYENGGIKAVAKYIDSTEWKTFASNSWVSKLMKLLDGSVEDRKEFDKEVKEGFNELVDIEKNIYALNSNLQGETDTELVSYINANLEILAKKLKWYYD